jgi:hypothetical protein
LLEKWQNFGLFEQLGNIGSEVSRASKWQGKDREIFSRTFERGLELFDLTLEDPRWGELHHREIARAREVFCDAYYGGHEYGSKFEDLVRYFDMYAIAANRKNEKLIETTEINSN